MKNVVFKVVILSLLIEHSVHAFADTLTSMSVFVGGATIMACIIQASQRMMGYPYLQPVIKDVQEFNKKIAKKAKKIKALEEELKKYDEELRNKKQELIKAVPSKQQSSQAEIEQLSMDAMRCQNKHDQTAHEINFFEEQKFEMLREAKKAQYQIEEEQFQVFLHACHATAVAQKPRHYPHE